MTAVIVPLASAYLRKAAECDRLAALATSPTVVVEAREAARRLRRDARNLQPRLVEAPCDTEPAGGPEAA